MRIHLPYCLTFSFPKGRNCQAKRAEHHWYKQDDEFSACYHCQEVRPGRLWEQPDVNG